MAFFGKIYKLVKQENIEEYGKVLELTPEQIKKMVEMTASEKFEKNGDSYTNWCETSEFGSKEFKFKSGEEFDEHYDDVHLKTTIVVDGNKITKTQIYGNHKINTIKEFKDDQLIDTINTSTWAGPARRYFVAAS